MKLNLFVTEEKFFRRFDRAFPPAPVLSRLTVSDQEGFCARRRGDRFWIYRRKKGFFSLFSLTLYGCLREKEHCVSVCFSRSLFVLPPWLLWCGFLLYTGFSILFREPDFALWFLIPGAFLLLPLFLFSKKEKKRLLDALVPLTKEEKET